MKKIFLSILLLYAGSAIAQDSTQYWIYKYSTPEIATKAFHDKGLDTSYSFSYHLNPFYLRGDFNGDKLNDIAIPATENKTNKTGIAIIHSGTNEVFMFGAGEKFIYLTDDCKNINIWSVDTPGVYKSHWEKHSVKVKYEAINIGIFECSGGLLYWDGKKYNWYHLTD